MRSSRIITVLQQYDEMSQALFGRMVVPPPQLYRRAIDTCIRALRRDGIWPRLDLLYLLASHDAQAARLNAISDTFPLTVAGTPVFTAGEGYAGNGTDGRLDVSGTWTPKQMGQDSALVGIYTRTAAAYDGVTARYGAYTGAGRLLRRPATEANIEWRINDGTSANTAVAAQTGHFAVRRTASNERSLWRNGAQVATNAQASTANSSVFHLFSANGAGFGDPQYSFAYAGAHLTDAQMASINTILTAYLTAVGAI